MIAKRQFYVTIRVIEAVFLEIPGVVAAINRVVVKFEAALQNLKGKSERFNFEPFA